MSDTISRQAVKELAHKQVREKYCGVALKEHRDFYIKLADSIIDSLPPIQPDNNSENPNSSDVISRQAAIDAIEAEKTKRGDYLTSSYVGYEIAEKVVAKLPPAEPKRGRWIPVTNGRGGYECDQCHEYAPSYQNGDEHLSNFCPNCGAKMEVTT